MTYPSEVIIIIIIINFLNWQEVFKGSHASLVLPDLHKDPADGGEIAPLTWMLEQNPVLF